MSCFNASCFPVDLNHSACSEFMLNCSTKACVSFVTLHRLCLSTETDEVSVCSRSFLSLGARINCRLHSFFPVYLFFRETVRGLHRLLTSVGHVTMLGQPSLASVSFHGFPMDIPSLFFFFLRQSTPLSFLHLSTCNIPLRKIVSGFICGALWKENFREVPSTAVSVFQSRPHSGNHRDDTKARYPFAWPPLKSAARPTSGCRSGSDDPVRRSSAGLELSARPTLQWIAWSDVRVSSWRIAFQ